MMKKFVMIAFVVAAVFSAVWMVTNSEKSTDVATPLRAVEALSGCESWGWSKNDGNCVSNDRGDYFCASDTWYHITDCKQ